jgi:hypothetical protein
MNLFRSEDHIARWLGGRRPGATVPLPILRELGEAWYGDRLAPGWRPRTREESQAILDRLGLTGELWRLR